MQLSQAKEIVNNSALNQQWLQLTQDEADTLMESVEAREDRQECCFPYDCMHHEQCDGEYLCGSCKRGAERWEVVEKVLQKFPEAYQYATALTRMGDAQVVAYELETMRQLEAVGDYAAVQRMWDGE